MQHFKKNIFTILEGNMYVIKDELEHFEEKFATLQILLSKSKDPDPIRFFRIQIRPGQKNSGSDRIHSNGLHLA